MKRIALTQGQYALVDDGDFERLNQFKWYAARMGNTFYAVRMSPVVNGKGYRIWMHHEIIGRPSKGLMVDHREGRGTDNQRHNLRFVTRRQNCQNRKNGHKESSKFPGVSWNKRSEKWLSKIWVNGKPKQLGLFIDEFEAFSAYKQAVEAIGEEMVGGIKCP